jgi:hypothetical protein
MPAIHGGKYQRLYDPMVRSATKYLRRDAPISSTRHKRSVWAIPTEPFKGSHTAIFPSRLVEPCILAGSSEAGCCSRCGRPWERVVEVTYRPLSNRREGRKDRRVFELEQRQMREARTTGWRPTCECGADVTPAVVLDPFAGTGTTLKVAKQHARAAVGIELSAPFVDMIRRRCSSVTSSTAREEAA